MKTKMFVLLQSPSSYYVVVEEANSKRAGWLELNFGSWEDMQNEMYWLEEYDRKHCQLLQFKCAETFSLIQTTKEMLAEILKLEPDFLNNKIQI